MYNKKNTSWLFAPVWSYLKSSVYSAYESYPGTSRSCIIPPPPRSRPSAQPLNFSRDLNPHPTQALTPHRLESLFDFRPNFWDPPDFPVIKGCSSILCSPSCAGCIRPLSLSSGLSTLQYDFLLLVGSLRNFGTAAAFQEELPSSTALVSL